MAGGRFCTSRVVSPFVRPFLGRPLGRLFGRHLAILRYTGAVTGRRYSRVCRYARTRAAVWVLVGDSAHQTWWRDLRRPADVDVWLAGERVRARAVAVVGAEQPRETRRGLRAYLAQVPSAAGPLRLPDAHDPSALAATAKRIILIRIDLPPEPDTAA